MNTTTTPHGVIITETEELDDVLQHDQTDQEWFQYLRDTLPKLGERRRAVMVALIKAFYDGALSVEEYDEVGREGVEALLVERGLVDVEAGR